MRDRLARTKRFKAGVSGVLDLRRCDAKESVPVPDALGSSLCWTKEH